MLCIYAVVREKPINGFPRGFLIFKYTLQIHLSNSFLAVLFIYLAFFSFLPERPGCFPALFSKNE